MYQGLKYNFSNVQKLIIIRHGESLWNKQKKWAGWSDVKLSQNGIKEAIQCGKMLKQHGFVFDIAYTSLLTRSIQTLNYILDSMNLHYIPVKKSWRLNEKHYGSLTGQSKVQVAKQYGQQKVAEWRRSFNVSPPPVDINDQKHPSKDRRYANIDATILPSSQNQGDLIMRLQPLWKQEIREDLINGKNILISAHGGSARALVKLISNLPNEKIMQFNLPNATPLVYTFEIDDNKNLKINNMQFIGDANQITAKMQKVKDETKIQSI